MARVRGPFLGAVALSAAVSVLMLTGPVYMIQVYDRVLASGSVPTLLGLFALAVMLYGFLGLYSFLRDRLLTRIAYRIDDALAEPAFRTALARAADQDDEPAGRPDPVAELATLRGFVSSQTMSGLLDLPFVPFFLAVTFLIHPVIGLATLAGAAVAAALAFANRRATRRILAEGAGMQSATDRFSEVLRGSAAELRAMGMEDNVLRRRGEMHAAAAATLQGGAERGEGYAAASRTMRMLLQSALLTVGAALAIAGAISPGMIIAASVIAGRALAPLDQTIGQWPQVERALRARRTLRETALAEGPRAVTELPQMTGEVTLKGVTLESAFSDRGRVLDGIDLRIAPGEAVGVVGHNASGKSTLARVLVGAQAPDAGEVRLDGATHDQWSAEALSHGIGYLPQRVDLLPGTIAENIARFDPARTDAEVIEAARRAGVHKMILSMPQGYDTRIGGRAPLSGGQVQRIGLARAVIGRPRLVVLDEPDAHLDVAGDGALLRVVADLVADGAAVVLMTHRPAGLQAIDRLVVLQDGRIVQDGPKDRLIAGGPDGAARRERAAGAAGPAGSSRPGRATGPTRLVGSARRPRRTAAATQDETDRAETGHAETGHAETDRAGTHRAETRPRKAGRAAAGEDGPGGTVIEWADFDRMGTHARPAKETGA